MLTAIAVSPDRSLSEGLQRLAVASRQVSIYKSLNRYPTPYELVRICNACDPDFLFLDLSDWKAAAPIVAKINKEFPKTSIMGFGPSWIQDLRAAYESSGIPVLLSTPFDLDDFQNGILSAFRSTRGGIHENLVAFLPAKAGNGSSVTAFNVAGALAGDLSRNVLLIEGDLHSGVLSVRASFAVQYYLQDILDNPEVITRGEWLRYIVERHGFDILPAGRSRVSSVPRWSNYFHLLQYASGEYNTVIADLPETINDATAEVVLRAGAVHVVCTAERPSLELARRRCKELAELGVEAGRVSLVVNRLHPTDITPTELAELMSCPVAKALPNDYQSLRTATDEGLLVNRDTELGRAYLSFARMIAGLPEQEEAAEAGHGKHRFRLAAFLGR